MRTESPDTQSLRAGTTGSAKGPGLDDRGGLSLSSAQRGTKEADDIYGGWEGNTWQSSVGAKGSAVTAWRNWRVNDPS